MNKLFFMLADAAREAAPVVTETMEVVEETAQQPPPRGMFSIETVGLIVGMVALFWFMTSRANKKQRQRQQELMNKMVKGRRVMLSSGIYGTVVEVKENTCVIEIADKVRIEAAKSAVVDYPEDKPAAEEKK